MPFGSSNLSTHADPQIYQRFHKFYPNPAIQLPVK